MKAKPLNSPAFPRDTLCVGTATDILRAGGRAIYVEHRPHSLLAPFVECYWTRSAAPPTRRSYRVPPDGCLDILFERKLGADFTGFAIGAMTRPSLWPTTRPRISSPSGPLTWPTPS